MRRTFLKAMVALAVTSLTAGLAVAANVHFTPKGEPALVDQGLTAQVCGTLSGLGNEDITITLVADGLADVTLISPGGNAAPGQNKIPVRSIGQITIAKEEIKNGTVSFCVDTVAPTVSAKEAGAPNKNWTVVLNDVSFTNATLTVTQGNKKGGTTVLQQNL